MSNQRLLALFSVLSVLVIVVLFTSCLNGWKEKTFSELSDKEIEATMNLEKRVFDDVLGKDIPEYYQTESLFIPKKSGYFYGEKENIIKLAEPIVAVSIAYPSVKIDESVISQLEKIAESKEIEWKGLKVAIVDAIVEVDHRGAGEYFDKITIYPLKVKVLE